MRARLGVCPIVPVRSMVRGTDPDGTSIHAESTGSGDEAIEELLVDQLRDILHVEKRLTKALPKMAGAAHSRQLQRLFEIHLAETEAQAERLTECLRLLDAPARVKARCQLPSNKTDVEKLPFARVDTMRRR